MHFEADKDTEKAWDNWVSFTMFTKWSVIAVIIVLGLMAAFLL